jgi:hypothetical protein
MKTDELQMLETAANGAPYLLIVQNGADIKSLVKPGFDVSLVIQWLTRFMEREPQYKSQYADMIIELSKALKQ